MNKTLASLAFLLGTTAAVYAQPIPPPSPWIQNGNTVSYPGAVTVPSTVTGGSEGNGSINGATMWANGTQLRPIAIVNNFASSMSAGTPDDCTHDATPAVNAAVASLPGQGGTVVYLPTGGCYMQNVVDTWIGVTLQGPGNGKSVGTPPTSNYIQAYTSGSPALQIGDGSTSISGWVVRDMNIYNNYKSLGLEILGGASGGNIYDVSVENCSVACVKVYSSSSSGPITFDNWFGGSIGTGTSGDDIVLEGTGTGYANGLTFNGVYIEGPNATSGGHLIRLIGATNVIFSGGYGQINGGVANGLSIEKPPTGAGTPTSTFINFPFDNAGVIGNIASENQFGDPASSDPASELPALINSNAIPTISYAAVTTGTISASSAALTITGSTTQFHVGRTVVVYGAGASGANLKATVNSVSGSVVTLSANASTAVSGAFVGVGALRDTPFMQLAQAMPLVGGIQISNQQTVGGSDISGYNPNTGAVIQHSFLFATGGYGNVFPFSTGGNLVWDLGQAPIVFGMASTASPAVSSLTRSGTTVTVTFASGADNMHVGGQIAIAGDLSDQGINGTWTIATVNSGSTVATFTSSVSGTISSPSGTIIAQIYNSPYFQYGNLHLAGGYLSMFDQNGNDTQVLYQSATSSNFFMQTPDTTNGGYVMGCGSSASTSGCLQVAGGGINTLVSNRFGALAIGGASANASSPVLVLPPGNASQTPSSNALYLENGAGGTAGYLFTKNASGVVQELLQTGSFTNSTLPACSTSVYNLRVVATDSTVAAASNFGSVYSNGGSNVVPLYCDGTNWRIG